MIVLIWTLFLSMPACLNHSVNEQQKGKIITASATRATKKINSVAMDSLNTQKSNT